MPQFPVLLTHDGDEGLTTAATRTSLRALKARGWRPVEADDLTSRTRAELDEMAVAVGIEPDGYRTKADLVEAIADAQTPDA